MWQSACSCSICCIGPGSRNAFSVGVYHKFLPFFSSLHSFLSFFQVCPICTDKVDVNLVSHMSSLHQSFLKDKRRNRQGSSGSHYATLAFLKEDPHERISGSSRAAPVSTVPDPLLSSFVGNFYEVDLPRDTKVESLDETEVGSDNLELKAAESVDEPLLPEVKEERTRRSQFVQGLILSLMFDDIF
ncbi:hypothetical protein GQ55_3G432400 [Panicum hallii var. hallii]|jgi:hypothetical protein|uniref:Di19 C-terminal domain-containing protein n=1 Tax=Panicum hallii var. hallii TaxID=1504633 RepID=A0A2T7EHV2_9POAL|nr:hypothetical protein GQ55_3G432400 [Panicum hallii var. hallii]